MKAITIHQPWAWAITSGSKRCENRTWPTHHRGPLIIHASKNKCDDEVGGNLLARLGIELPEIIIRRAAIGIVDVVDCLPLDEYLETYGPDPFACGPFCWRLDNARAFAQPIECRGWQGLYNLDSREIRRALRLVAA